MTGQCRFNVLLIALDMLPCDRWLSASTTLYGMARQSTFVTTNVSRLSELGQRRFFSRRLRDEPLRLPNATIAALPLAKTHTPTQLEE